MEPFAPASSICTYKILDKDGDGHPPPVCGGDDCDDNDWRQFPGNKEECDGKDNNCDGQADNGATCSSSTDVCKGGQCVCKTEYQCDAFCVDKTNDPKNCGGCGTACGSIAPVCKTGKCTCDPMNQCGGVCVNFDYDDSNCGGCGHKCPSGQVCLSAKCQAPPVDLIMITYDLEVPRDLAFRPDLSK